MATMTEFWPSNSRLGRALEGVAALMDETVRAAAFPIADEVATLVASNGKMLRPALLYIGAGFGPKAREDSLRSLAASVELLHVSTLIHDDYLDDATLRRGQPTLHTQVGPKEAVLAGDWLFSRCFLLSAASTDPGNALTLARVIAAIVSSEIRQDLDKWSYSTSVRSYLRKIAGKTAALFALSLQTGAQEAKAPKLVAQRLRRAGYDMGMAFQVIDDILDFESTEGVMRKPVGRDLAEGLCTLPLIHALRGDEAGIRSSLAALRDPDGRVDEAAVQALIARCTELGGVDEARKEAALFTERAKGEMALLPACAARDELEDLADRLLVRDY